MSSSFLTIFGVFSGDSGEEFASESVAAVLQSPGEERWRAR